MDSFDRHAAALTGVGGVLLWVFGGVLVDTGNLQAIHSKTSGRSRSG
jgi:hypothetical protein